MTTTGAAELAGRPAAWRPPRWVVLLFALGAVVLLPWVAVLVVALPSAHRSAHWDIAWAGFDVGLALLLAAVAVTAWRRSPWFEGAATSAATLLLVDAWFDVLTSSSRAELALAVCEAAFVELPLAVLCLVLAHDAARRLFAPSVSAPWRRLRRDRLGAEGAVSGRGMQGQHGSLQWRGAAPATKQLEEGSTCLVTRSST